MEKRLKRVAIISLIVAGALLLAALVIGILNALVADGEWTLGWNDYRYDESGYTVGEGSIPVDVLTGIELDWIDGNVEIVACDDAFPSLSESAPNDLPESAKLRWMVDADGVLHIKYRKASWFFGFGTGDRNKMLTLRVPKRFFEGLETVEVEAGSADVQIDGLISRSLDVEIASGALLVRSSRFLQISLESGSGRIDVSLLTCPAQLDIENKSGNVSLELPKDASFALKWETGSGQMTSDFLLSQAGEVYTCKEGTAKFEIKSKKGSLILSAIE